MVKSILRYCFNPQIHILFFLIYDWGTSKGCCMDIENWYQSSISEPKQIIPAIFKCVLFSIFLVASQMKTYSLDFE